MQILILEDEQQAGEKLKRFIKGVKPDAIIDWHRSIEDGLNFLTHTNNLDLIFSDIELLDGNVFELYRKQTFNCPIIFCTAYNSFYLEAFQTNGIAYLLKPYNKEDFAQAWSKYESLFHSPIKSKSQLSSNLVEKMIDLLGSQSKKHKSTFSVKKRDGVFLLNTADVAYFQAQGDFVYAIDTKNQKHVLNYTLTAIEESIDPTTFIKINRSELINRHHIVKYHIYSKNRLAITIQQPSMVLYTSNSRSSSFKKWLEQ